MERITWKLDIECKYVMNYVPKARQETLDNCRER